MISMATIVPMTKMASVTPKTNLHGSESDDRCQNKLLKDTAPAANANKRPMPSKPNMMVVLS